MNTINYNIKQMNKYFLTSVLILGIVPTMCLGASARYTALVRQKKQKMEQLEKCLGTQTNLKIAGISTLGLTAVGVAGNIAEAKIISDNNAKIEKLDDKIDKQKLDIEKKKWEIEEARKLAAAAQPVATATGQSEASVTETNYVLKTIAEQDIAAIEASGGNIGDRVVAHGYEPEQLPANLSSRFAKAMLGFMNKCYGLKGHNGILKVSAGSKTETDWHNLQPGQYTEETILQNLNEHEIALCKAETCVEATHVKRGNMCVDKTSDCTDAAKTDATNPNAAKVISASKEGENCKIQQCDDGFKPSADGKKCEQEVASTPVTPIPSQRTPLSDSDKMDCAAKLLRDFGVDRIPERYNAKYNEYLTELQNRVADKNGIVSFTVNYTQMFCTKNQKWSECRNSSVVLPAIAHIYTKMYAENEECTENNNVSTAGIRIVSETELANIEFERNLQDCERHGAVGYDKNKGCLCENELTHEYNGTKCIKIDTEAKNKCTSSGGDWKKAKCVCPATQPLVNGKCIDGTGENEIKCKGLGGDWINGSCENLDYTRLSDEDACFFEGGSFSGGFCACPEETEIFDAVTKTCKAPDPIVAPVSGTTIAVAKPSVTITPTVVKSPDESGCEGSGGTWNLVGITCNCPDNAAFWDAVDKKCKNPVVATPSVYSAFLTTANN